MPICRVCVSACVSGGGGSGDMTKIVYDPNSVEADAFNQDNMVDGLVNKNYTATDQNKLAIAEVTTNKNVAGGYPSLDGTGRIPSSQLPVSTLEFKGSFGSAGSTTGGDLPAAGNTSGDYYVCDTDGFVSGVAGLTFDIGDNALFDGASWVKIDNTQVQSDFAETDTSSPAFINNQALSEFIRSENNIVRPGQTTETLINQQANVLENYFANPLVFQPNRTGNHLVKANFLCSMNNAANDFLAEIEIVGDQGFNRLFEITQIEFKDVAGAGFVADILAGGAIVGSINVGTNNAARVHFEYPLLLVNTEIYTIQFRWGATLLDARAAVQEAFVGIEERISG